MNRFFLSTLAAFMLAFSFSAAAQQVAQQVAPQVDGVRLESEGSLYWLHFDADADSLWPKLKDFWANEGISLKKEEPQLGYMETEWSKDLLLDKMLSILLSDQAPERRERFRLRLERIDGDGTKVFIYHSAYGILFDEEAVYTGYLPASPALEIEMLSRLALYSGAGKQQIEQHVASFATTRLKAARLSADEYEIASVPGTRAFVREKLQRTLARMDAEVSQQADGRIVARYSKVPELETDNTAWGIDDSSDLEETGFGDAEVGTAARLVYLIELKPAANTVTLRIRADKDNSDMGRGLSEFSSALAEQLESR